MTKVMVNTPDAKSLQRVNAQGFQFVVVIDINNSHIQGQK